MNLIKKIKRFLGLELPYLLEEEEEKIEIRGNIMRVSNDFSIIKTEEQLKQFAKASSQSGMTMNEARKILGVKEL